MKYKSLIIVILSVLLLSWVGWFGFDYYSAHRDKKRLRTFLELHNNATTELERQEILEQFINKNKKVISINSTKAWGIDITCAILAAMIGNSGKLGVVVNVDSDNGPSDESDIVVDAGLLGKFLDLGCTRFYN